MRNKQKSHATSKEWENVSKWSWWAWQQEMDVSFFFNYQLFTPFFWKQSHIFSQLLFFLHFLLLPLLWTQLLNCLLISTDLSLLKITFPLKVNPSLSTSSKKVTQNCNLFSQFPPLRRRQGSYFLVFRERKKCHFHMSMANFLNNRWEQIFFIFPEGI